MIQGSLPLHVKGRGGLKCVGRGKHDHGGSLVTLPPRQSRIKGGWLIVNVNEKGNKGRERRGCC